MVELSFLGRAQSSVDGVPVSGDAAQRKRILLLALLADPPIRPLSRDRLVGMLWPDNPEESARHLLSAALHVVKRALGTDVFSAGQEDVALRADRVTVDLVEFQSAVDANDWERALSLHRRPFLDGVFITEGNALESWVEDRRRRYTSGVARALESKAREQTEQGLLAEAVTTWKTLAALDPHSGRYTLGLIRALVAFGDRTAALRQARIHEQLLEAEFETVPDPEIVSLVEELKGDPRPATGDAGRREGAGMSSEEATGGAVTREGAAMSSEEATGGRTPESAGGESAAGADAPSWAPRGGASRAAGEGPLSGPGAPKVIAVLPFAEPEHGSPGGYLGDGIAERILDELGRFEGVRSVARTSSFAFRGAGGDIREIGKTLGADAILEGSVRRWESRGRIWVQLVSAQTGLQLWSQTYDREIGDLFEIQDEIGREVATALSARLRGEQPGPTPRPVSLQAWDLYIRGRHGWYERSIESLEQALECFRGAIEVDPTYAEAWAGIADAYSVLGSYVYGALAPDQALPSAREAAEKALVLRPDLPAAHAALGGVRFNFDWDFVGAERSYRRALAVDPGNAPARHWYAFLLAAQGRWPEVQAEVRRARGVDPISPLGFTTRAHLLYFRREFESALEGVDAALQHDPTFRSALFLRVLVLAQLGRMDDATRQAEGVLAATGSAEPMLLGILSYVRGLGGRAAEAEGLRSEIESLAGERFIPAECLVLAMLGVGDLDGAMTQLQAAFNQRSASMIYLGMEPVVDPLRSDPRFLKLLAGIKPRPAPGRIRAD